MTVPPEISALCECLAQLPARIRAPLRRREEVARQKICHVTIYIYIYIYAYIGYKYEGWNFNSGNYLFTTDTKEIHVTKFYSPSM